MRSADQVGLSAPNNTYIPAGGVYVSDTPMDMTEAVGRLIEMVRADGYIPKPGHQIRFKFKRAEKIDRCMRMLHAMRLPYSTSQEKERPDVTQIVLEAHPTIDIVRRLLGESKQKGYQSWVLDIPPATREAMLDEMQYWDGHVSARSKGENKQITLHTSKQTDAYWIHEMAVLTGRSSKVTYNIPNTRGFSRADSVLSHVTIRTKSYVKTLYPPVEIQHTGTVYCLQVPTQAFLVRRNGATWVTGNCAFDAAIMNWRFGITPKGYLDTMSMGQALHGINQSVSLKNLATLYNVGVKGEEVLNALGKRRADFTPTELTRYGEYCKNDCDLCWELFQGMRGRFSTQELKLIDLTIRMFAEPKLVLDQELLFDHVAAVRKKNLDATMLLMDHLGVTDPDEMKPHLMSNQKFAALLEQLGAEVPMKLSPTTGKPAPAFAKTDEAFIALQEHDNPIVAAAVNARLANKSTIEESRALTLIGVADRGTMPFPLKYSGAAETHRWSGFDFNPQNMTRGGKLRDAVCAPKGYKILAADLSNIELRLGLWLAGQDDKVQLIRDGKDLYAVLASELFNIPYDQIGKKSKERTTAKVISLAGIFGTSAVKLKDILRLQGKLTVTMDAANHYIASYREGYYKVVEAWKQGARVLEALTVQATCDFLRPGVLAVDLLGIRKPSGLYLTYPDLQKGVNAEGRTEYTYAQKRGQRSKVYSSKVYQKAVQSLARDIFSEHVLKIDKRYHVVGLVHDEVLCLVRDEEVEEAEAFVLSTMRTPPAFAPDLPLDAEVGSADTYGAAKS